MTFVHKLFGTTPGKGIQPKEAFSYSVAGFGQNMICTLIGTFLMVFYTDAVGLLPAGVAYLMLGVRLFDAFNDPIMGSIVDRTRTRWGKLRLHSSFHPYPHRYPYRALFYHYLGKLQHQIYLRLCYLCDLEHSLYYC